MAVSSKASRTIVGTVNDSVLRFTVGRDPVLDMALVEADCIGTAAHVTMLSRIKRRPILTEKERRRVVSTLARIISDARNGRFRISMRDQDVHMAVERELTSELGELGRKVHTGRSRNDQVATDIRLYSRVELLSTMDEAAGLAGVLLAFAKKHRMLPMVGRTHQQPAMPSSVGLWASAYAESLLDDIDVLGAAIRLNDRSPLGAAAGYGVPLKIDRNLTARLMGFPEPVHNVMHAINSRGKCESVILFALGQIMLTLSRISADLIMFGMPEFGYFILPAEYCTGSSIMPQKRNPDVLELIRAKAANIMASAFAVSEITRGLPGGYNRDMQETKAHLVQGFSDTRASLQILAMLMKGMKVNRQALLDGFSPEVFATDRALELVGRGVPFRDAYNRVKDSLFHVEGRDPREAIAQKTHLGAPAGLDLALLERRVRAAKSMSARGTRVHYNAASKLLCVKYRPATFNG